MGTFNTPTRWLPILQDIKSNDDIDGIINISCNIESLGYDYWYNDDIHITIRVYCNTLSGRYEGNYLDIRFLLEVEGGDNWIHSQEYNLYDNDFEEILFNVSDELELDMNKMNLSLQHATTTIEEMVLKTLIDNLITKEEFGGWGARVRNIIID